MALSNSLGDNEADRAIQEDEEGYAEEGYTEEIRGNLGARGCEAEHFGRWLHVLRMSARILKY
jgi:hypothetical protein